MRPDRLHRGLCVGEAVGRGRGEVCPGPEGQAGGGVRVAASVAQLNRPKPGSALGGESVLLARAEAGAADVADDLTAGDEGGVLKRQRGCAKGAFRGNPADIPMGPPATGAVIGLMVAIDDVIAALAGGEDKASAAGF